MRNSKHISSMNSMIIEKEAQTDEFRQVASAVISPYGNGNAAKQMVKICLATIKEPINLKKKFYDL